MSGGSNQEPFYEITSPIFDKVTIHLDQRYYQGKSFVIETKHNTENNIYIQSATLNGQPLNKVWFSHNDLTQGGTLQLELGSQANDDWGSKAEYRPASM